MQAGIQEIPNVQSLLGRTLGEVFWGPCGARQGRDPLCKLNFLPPLHSANALTGASTLGVKKQAHCHPRGGTFEEEIYSISTPACSGNRRESRLAECKVARL